MGIRIVIKKANGQRVERSCTTLSQALSAARVTLAERKWEQDHPGVPMPGPRIVG